MNISECLDKAQSFTDENLQECCEDLLIWDRYGLLPKKSKVRDLAEILESIDNYFSLKLAENMIKSKAMKFTFDNYKKISTL